MRNYWFKIAFIVVVGVSLFVGCEPPHHNDVDNDVEIVRVYQQRGQTGKLLWWYIANHYNRYYYSTSSSYIPVGRYADMEWRECNTPPVDIETLMETEANTIIVKRFNK